ncbi:MAG TPA: flagellar hook-associated protein FlgK [Micrococcaceae bacterium]
MSTFGALNTAFTGLTAAQQGLTVVGNNIANVNTEGYTRQRLATSAAPPLATVGLFSAGTKPGNGVSVDGVTRLGDTYLDAKARTTGSAAGYTAARSSALTGIEDITGEPGTNGVSAKLQAFWTAWSGVANQPGEAAPAAVLFGAANDVSNALSAGYSKLEDQWGRTRGQASDQAAQLNDAGAQVAALNAQIRSAQASGGSANELMDQRSILTGTIAALAGGTVKDGGNGMVDVYVGGNAIVTGATSRKVVLSGADSLASAATGQKVLLNWADGSGSAVALDGGQLAGTLSVLAPAAGGSGGAIAEAAASYDAVATAVAATVNAAQASGSTPGSPVTAGANGQPFFSTGDPAAKSLTVLLTSAADLATGTPGAGPLDGSHAAATAASATVAGSPDSAWTSFIATLGSTSRSAQQQDAQAQASAASAATAQTSSSSVSLDEENVNLLAYQHAYQASARVLTAVDDMLDTLINKTGLVGR